MSDLNDRVKFIDTWIKNKAAVVTWMGGFFFPQGFLSSILQVVVDD